MNKIRNEPRHPSRSRDRASRHPVFVRLLADLAPYNGLLLSTCTPFPSGEIRVEMFIGLSCGGEVSAPQLCLFLGGICARNITNRPMAKEFECNAAEAPL